MNEKRQTATEQQDDAYYEALSQWAESDEAIDPPGATWQAAGPETRAAARAMLAEVMSPTSSPPPSGAGSGARATAEGRTPSAVMRDAVAAYMRTT